MRQHVRPAQVPWLPSATTQGGTECGNKISTSAHVLQGPAEIYVIHMYEIFKPLLPGVTSKSIFSNLIFICHGFLG